MRGERLHDEEEEAKRVAHKRRRREDRAVKLFENADIVVLDKPDGVSMATSSAAGRSEADVLARLLAACAERPDGGLRLVHRLDVGTTGVALLAKTDAGHRALTRAFQAGGARKTYRALVWGHPEPAEGLYEDPLGRDPKDGRRMKPRREGKRAQTRYRTLERFPALADLALFPETGRTHQLRVHLAAHGHPIAGDDLYGSGRRWESVREPRLRRALAQLTRPLLHALRIEVPEMGLDVSAPLPADYLRLLEALRVADSGA
jgi:23S rRNA pseudouridine1911/1915/1917 synthase